MVNEILAAAPSLLIGSLIYGAGRFHGKKRGIKEQEEKSKIPICSCSHSKSEHSDGSGRCLAQIERASKYNRNGQTIGWAWVDCPCQYYLGPDPLFLAGV